MSPPTIASATSWGAVFAGDRASSTIAPPSSSFGGTARRCGTDSARRSTSNGVTCFPCSKALTSPAETRTARAADCSCRSGASARRRNRWPQACTEDMALSSAVTPDRLDRRASAVYRNQPRFSIFGVGPYTFCKWKVMVSGFYKSWRFVAVGPVENRPVLCDDTCYFLPCRSAGRGAAASRAS